MLIVVSAFCFACMNVCVRLAGDIPTLQKSFFRNLIALGVAVVMMLRGGTGFLPSNKRNIPDLLVRATFGFLGLISNFYAVDHLVMADAAMLQKMAPFFAVLASVFLLKEKLSPMQGLALVGAFGGALCIIKPTFGNMDVIPSLIGLFGGFCGGVAYTLVRRLSQNGEKNSYIVFVFSAFSCLAAVPYLLLNYTPMTLQQTLWLLGAGICAAGGQFSVTGAYSCAPAREISVYDYSQVIFAAILGVLFFGDQPDALSVLGYVVICGMALLNFWHNNRWHVSKS